MVDTTQGLPDSRASIWDDEPVEHAAGRRWVRPLEALHRLSEALALRRARSSEHGRDERSSGELTTQPLGGRGHALRDAHRSLRQHLRQHRKLQSLLPHLCYIEQALGRQGSAALLDMPLWVLQRGLRQLDRLPWDPHPEPMLHPLNTLRLRLIEAVEIRRLHDEVQQPAAAARSGDGFGAGVAKPPVALDPLGLEGLEGPDSLPPAGIVVDEAPDADIDNPPRPPGRPGPPPGPPGPRGR